jgi:hypothetical protein
MKKIGICTLHDANPNFGATLQAFALQEVLKKMGYEPEFIRFKPEKAKRVRKVKANSKMYKPNPKFSPVNTSNIKINKGIIDSSKYLNICDEVYDKFIHEHDTIILGSDELWNLRNDSFIHRKEYYGHDLNSSNIIAYAPCSNGTSKTDFEQHYNNELNLDKIKILSARDKATQKFIKEVSNLDVPIVLDPTLLIDDIEKYVIEPEDENYILIYDYSVKPERKKKIQEFAKAKNLKIYSIGFYNSWADRNIDADIFEFLGYVKKAKYVVTATFHGSIFSIIFKKQFVSTVGNCLKIGDILERLNLGDRDITNIEKIESVIDRLIDYDEVEKLKLKYRKESMEYLEKAILNGEKI